MSGVSTTNLNQASALDEVVGNMNVGGIRQTARAPIENFAKQLAAEGPISAFTGVVGKKTLAQLQAVTGAKNGTPGHVYDDPNPSNNGIYTSENNIWTFQRTFPDTAAKLTLTNGTAPNALAAATDAGISPARIQIFIITPAFDNDGPVTLRVNGEAGKPVRNINGDEFLPGEWSAGRVKLLGSYGDHFRILQDPDVEALSNVARESAEQSLYNADRAEVAEARAVAARDIAAGYASDAISGGMDPGLSTVVGMPAITIPEGINHFTVAGHYKAGDGRGGLAIDEDNGTEPWFTTADGRTWWRAQDVGAARIVGPETFGGGVAKTAIQNDAAFAALSTTYPGVEVALNSQTYAVTDVPMGRWRNGFFKVGMLIHPTPDLLSRSITYKVTGGPWYDTWPQDMTRLETTQGTASRIRLPFMRGVGHGAADNRVMETVSTDGGVTWSEPVTLFGDRTAQRNAFGHAIMGGSQFIVVREGATALQKLYRRALDQRWEFANPFSTVAGSPIVTVRHPGHGRMTGDLATIESAGPAFNGITIGGGGNPYKLTRVDSDHYSIVGNANATATGSGLGDGDVVFNYALTAFEEIRFTGADIGTAIYASGAFSSSPTVIHSGAGTADGNLWFGASGGGLGLVHISDVLSGSPTLAVTSFASSGSRTEPTVTRLVRTLPLRFVQDIDSAYFNASRRCCV